ncbi:hypothetical protein PM082_015295 [Marasmius tenuissimus]|nr:hypothetical protein PM082_015295 [Marasmius tenuissimus]
MSSNSLQNVRAGKTSTLHMYNFEIRSQCTYGTLISYNEQQSSTTTSMSPFRLSRTVCRPTFSRLDSVFGTCTKFDNNTSYTISFDSYYTKVTTEIMFMKLTSIERKMKVCKTVSLPFTAVAGVGAAVGLNDGGLGGLQNEERWRGQQRVRQSATRKTAYRDHVVIEIIPLQVELSLILIGASTKCLTN